MDVPADLSAALEGRYQLLRGLGSGGMATVLVARDVRHGRDVAIKVLGAELGARGAERFAREIELTARMSHPNILPLLDSGTWGDSAYYVMPLVSGGSLRTLLDQAGELRIETAVRLAIDVADALDYAHRAGVVHRDIKPENILLQHDRPIVADFGIARLRDEAATQLTATGVSIGTPMYMAPEQVTGERAIDGRADIYALACMLYEMLTGAPPFAGPTQRAIMARHAADPPPSIRTVRSTVPPAVERVIHQAMAKSPADRFATAGDMRDALTAAISERRSAAPRWLRPALAAALLVAIAGTAAVAIARRPARTGSSAPAGVPPSLDSTRIAVLPMANLGPDSSDDYFAAGMTEEMISTLSDIAGLRVIARSAVARYTSTTRALPEIARELGVRSIIESTLRKERQRLRIGVRLIDAVTQEQRWSQQYDREMADMFAIQRDVARHVAEALRVRLRPGESSALAQLPTRNSEALELYLRAKAVGDNIVSDRRTLELTIGLLERAVTLDSNFALAHALLGERYAILLFGFSPGVRYRQLADASIARALALDSTLAEAYQARGDLSYTQEAGWPLDDALRDMQKAVALKPSLATAHAKLGVLLMHIGVFEPAMRELRASVALDPFQTFARLRIGRVFWQTQRFDSALAAFERGPDIPAEHALVLGYLARAEDGLRYADSVSARTGSNAGDLQAARAVLFARLGRVAEAERAMELGSTIGADAAHFHHAAFSLATACVLLDRPEEAVRWLTRMVNGGMPAFELIISDPVIVRLRGHPGYEALVRRERTRYDRLRELLGST